MIRAKENQPTPEEMQKMARQATMNNAGMFVATVALIKASKSRIFFTYPLYCRPPTDEMLYVIMVSVPYILKSMGFNSL